MRVPRLRNLYLQLTTSRVLLLPPKESSSRRVNCTKTREAGHVHTLVEMGAQLSAPAV